jgi:PqqA peptide cyclase
MSNSKRYVLENLTIKPNIYCSADCGYCSSRQLLFQASSQRRLGVEDWARVFSEAHELGVTYLDISGGEPTIYPELKRLVWEAKSLGWYTSLNSTAFQMGKVINDMESVKLDKVCVSFISLDQELNDRIRGGKDTWRETMHGIDVLSESRVDLALHFIASKDNYRELPDVVDFAFDKLAASLACVYPENDHKSFDMLMSRSQITEFQEEILPEAILRYNKRRRHDVEFPELFVDDGFGADYAEGRYWRSQKEAKEECDKPFNFLLIYPNGDVLPCNGIEYTHFPIVGNVLQQPLKDIWYGEVMEEFRRDRIEYCLNCPIKRHSGISVGQATIPPYSEPAIRQVPIDLPGRPDIKVSSWKNLREFRA